MKIAIEPTVEPKAPTVAIPIAFSNPKPLVCAINPINGAGSGTLTRTCTIPAGKSILFQPAGNECSYAENPSLKTESELRACAIAGDQVSSIQVSIDGRSLQNLQHYIVQTRLFNMTFPQNNLAGAPAGPTQSVSHAYLTFLQPLPSGNHEIHFNQVTLGNPATGTSSFAYGLPIILSCIEFLDRF